MSTYTRNLKNEIAFIEEIEDEHSLQQNNKDQPILLSYENNKYTATFPFYFECDDLRNINYDGKEKSKILQKLIWNI